MIESSRQRASATQERVLALEGHRDLFEVRQSLMQKVDTSNQARLMTLPDVKSATHLTRFLSNWHRVRFLTAGSSPLHI